jgi:dipeptidase E
VQHASVANLILAGGGGADDSRPLDELLVRLTGGGEMLYLPIAMPPDDSQYGACERWIHETFEPLGQRRITMWSALAGRTASHLDRFASLYIGGGNTYWLLQQIRGSQFDGALVKYARTRPVYGGSAGAILFGRTIDSAAHADRNDVGLHDFSGLDLAAGYSVWCHYESARDDALLRAFASTHAEPIIVLTERAGSLIDTRSAWSIGTDDALVFADRSFRPLPRVDR